MKVCFEVTSTRWKSGKCEVIETFPDAGSWFEMRLTRKFKQIVRLALREMTLANTNKLEFKERHP